jgi:N-acetylglucosaminyl-diphospho-decaprenol L-rhamnosyltransferase
VTVAYNSGDELRRCVAPLSRIDGVTVIVVDNASVDDGLATLADLDVIAIPLAKNGGFAYGCNRGWREGSSPYVLFINPDAEIDHESILRLYAVLEGDPSAGAAAPHIVHPDGRSAYSLRRFPRLSSTFAQALFLHRIFPNALWTDELIRNSRCYERRHSPEWVSGACLLVRRTVLEELQGWDEGFFLFAEDMDLCRRLHNAGHRIWFEPAALSVHVGGASASKQAVRPILAESRIRYLEKHHRRIRCIAERVGMALGAITHALVVPGERRGYLRMLLVAASLGHPSSADLE